MTEKAPYVKPEKLSEAEQALRDKIDTLEFPRMLCKADGTQVRVESKTEAQEALKTGLTLLPTAPDPHDGGTPNVDPATVLPPGVKAVIDATVKAACPPDTTVHPTPAPHPPMVTHTTPKPVEDDEDDDDKPNGKKKR